MSSIVKTGFDILERKGFSHFRKEKVGLIVNPSSVNRHLDGTHTVFLKNNINITVLFGPEHGIKGESQDQEKCEGFRDEKTGIPVYTLYGEQISPNEEMLKDVDTIVFDIQDVGARYYTFIWTMKLSMEKAARYRKKFIVLDRPNPINGVDIEGPMLEENYESFVGLLPIPVRHGMTVGELALLFNEEFNIGVELEVIKMEGWGRSLWFDETGVFWVPPSPNMPTLDTAILYPGMCLLEGTNISEGRGTTKPFEFFGAPWIKTERVLKELKGIKGCKLRAIYFKPLWSKYKGKICAGFQLHITDRKKFRPVRTALDIIYTVKKTHPQDFEWRKPPYEFEKDKLPFDILIGNSKVREMIEEGSFLENVEKTCSEGVEGFIRIREKYLLYE
jgi:uncharacterized protein YbbC (DUF1343 family)